MKKSISGEFDGLDLQEASTRQRMNFRASVLRPRSFILAGWEGGDLAASPRLGAQLSAGSSGSGAKTLEHQTDFNDSRLHEKERMVGGAKTAQKKMGLIHQNSYFT